MKCEMCAGTLPEPKSSGRPRQFCDACRKRRVADYSRKEYEANRDAHKAKSAARHKAIYSSPTRKAAYQVQHNAADRRRWAARRGEQWAGEPCAICERPDSGRVGRAMYWDHDHKTGEFRGWLCQACNLFIGQALDDPVRLRRAADYLERGALPTFAEEAPKVEREMLAALSGLIKRAGL